MAKARLEATVGLNTGRFRRGMARIRRSMGRFHSSVIAPIMRLGRVLAALGAAAVAAAVGGFALLINKTVKYGDTVGKAAKRTGLSTDELQRWIHAAGLAGSSIEDVEKGIKRMSSFLDDVDNGLSEAVRSMDKLMLSSNDFKNLNVDEAFDKMLVAIAGVEDPLKRSALAQDVFGRAGTKLLPLLSAGVDGLKAMKAEADRLGLILDPESIRQAEEFKDQMQRTRGLLAGMSRAFGAGFLPILNAALDKFQMVFQEFRKSDSFKGFGDALLRGAAVLLAAATLFAELPNKLQFVKDLITSAFDIGAAAVKLAILSAIEKIPGVKLGRKVKGAAKGVGAATRFLGEAAGAALTGGPAAGAAREAAEQELDAGLKSILEDVHDPLKKANEELAESQKKLKDMMDKRAQDLNEKDFMGLVDNILKNLKDAAAKKPPPAPEAEDGTPRRFSQLRSIGANIIGAAGGRGANVEKKQLNELEKQTKGISILNRNISILGRDSGGSKF